MEILGVGLPELIFILLLALVIFGPKDLEKAGKTMGRAIFKFLNSDSWKAIRQVGKLPAELVRQAGLDELREGLDTVRKGAAPPPARPGAATIPAAKAPAGTSLPGEGSRPAAPAPVTPPADPGPAEAEPHLRPPDEGKG
jgi:sec-independent protein translocase protein TatA